MTESGEVSDMDSKLQHFIQSEAEEEILYSANVEYEKSTPMLILDSSFNPPTIAHIALIDHALEQLSQAHVVLLLAITNADKTHAPSELPLRLELMKAIIPHLMAKHPKLSNASIAVTKHAKFADKCTSFSAPLYFILGMDTLVRVLDPKYYTDYTSSLEGLFSRVTGFIIFDRAETSYDRKSIPTQWQDKITFSQAPESESVSSTAVRKAIAAGKWDVVNHLCIEPVIQLIQQHELYTST